MEAILEKLVLPLMVGSILTAIGMLALFLTRHLSGRPDEDLGEAGLERRRGRGSLQQDTIQTGPAPPPPTPTPAPTPSLAPVVLKPLEREPNPGMPAWAASDVDTVPSPSKTMPNGAPVPVPPVPRPTPAPPAAIERPFFDPTESIDSVWTPGQAAPDPRQFNPTVLPPDERGGISAKPTAAMDSADAPTVAPLRPPSAGTLPPPPRPPSVGTLPPARPPSVGALPPTTPPLRSPSVGALPPVTAPQQLQAPSTRPVPPQGGGQQLQAPATRQVPPGHEAMPAGFHEAETVSFEVKPGPPPPPPYTPPPPVRPSSGSLMSPAPPPYSQADEPTLAITMPAGLPNLQATRVGSNVVLQIPIQGTQNGITLLPQRLEVIYGNFSPSDPKEIAFYFCERLTEPCRLLFSSAPGDSIWHVQLNHFSVYPDLHADVTWQNGRFVITSKVKRGQEERFQTRVNGAVLVEGESRVLTPGDIISLGIYRLRFS